MGMPIATDPVTMLPNKFARYAAAYLAFQIVHHDRTVHHR
jgi:hypothetical protein